MKNTFSLVSTYINWSSLSLSTPRMRKANDSCMVSAAHPLVKRRSYRLFRFSSCCYILKGDIYIERPPLRGDRRYPRGVPRSPTSQRWSSVYPAIRLQCFAKLSLRARNANCSVVGCKNQHQCLYFGPLCNGIWSEFNVNNIMMELGCHSKTSGNMCRLETETMWTVSRSLETLVWLNESISASHSRTFIVNISADEFVSTPDRRIDGFSSITAYHPPLGDKTCYPVCFSPSKVCSESCRVSSHVMAVTW